ncbi:hypothetical protein HB780_09560 (plasmid) [Rhizobium lusitanum]|uniref:hypothetical protein n=1 Tax=Rhizobium lusitanum TaxID=293958 RepID=UPI0016212BA5|nr:hypothetical protein [Rhizobium lusitanum]QND46744.1 hypothetical protein HB780_09560 [Rhizobium lusitanum]
MRYHLMVLIAICAAATFSMLGIISPVHANEGDMQATVGKPATIAISGATNPAPADVGTRIVVTVSGYEPSKTGPVTTVVSVHCGGDTQEIGRFGIFPDEAFSASAGTQPQRFSFLLPDDPACRQPRAITIHLEPQTGDGVGASVTIGSANIE